MPKFRKKPVVIEAEQWSGAKQTGFEGLIIRKLPRSEHNDSDKDATFFIKTLEGNHVLTKGDWIIKGVKGEFYPCKPEIFEMTYELVEE